MSTVKAPPQRRVSMVKQELAPRRETPTPRLRPVADSPPKPPSLPWHRTALALSLASGVLLWAAFPPLNLGLLAWLAPLGWLALIRAEVLPGKRPYRGIWLVGLVHWLVLLQFVRLPHWSAYFGWAALSLYLSVYPLAFVGLSRVAVHRMRVPLILAAPVVWTGLELLRSYLFTGFAVALLGHTQVGLLPIIQISDVFGAYGVSFVVMFGAACLASMLPFRDRRSPHVGRWRLWPAAPLAAVVVVCLAYGYFRLYEKPPGADDERVARVALIQRCFETRFDSDLETGLARAGANFKDYLDATVNVCRENPGLDLVVWPESMFAANEPDVQFQDEIQPPPDADPELFEERARSVQGAFHDKATYAARKVNRAGRGDEWIGHTQLLVGCESYVCGPHPPRRYNSALLIDPEGEVKERYYKMHRVMFGEYVPFGKLIPWLYALTPMSEGLTAGTGPQEFRVAGLRLAPSICFETTVPQLIRRQIVALEKDGSPPDVLVNVTNDGWFWGSNALDLHLTCGIFRAVEQRRPLLIAANTGFSAVVDGNGHVSHKGPRFASGNIVADIKADGRHSLYRQIGDFPAWGASLFVCLVAAVGCWGRFRRAS